MTTNLWAVLIGSGVGAVVALVFCLCFTDDMRWKGRR